MNADEHFEQAEHWLAVSNQRANGEYEPTLLARAQVHATLALAAWSSPNADRIKHIYPTAPGLTREQFDAIAKTAEKASPA